MNEHRQIDQEGGTLPARPDHPTLGRRRPPYKYTRESARGWVVGLLFCMGLLYGYFVWGSVLWRCVGASFFFGKGSCCINRWVRMARAEQRTLRRLSSLLINVHELSSLLINVHELPSLLINVHEPPGARPRGAPALLAPLRQPQAPARFAYILY